MVDVAGFLPRVVRQTVELVDAPYYLFVSTLSVYADLSRPTDEDSPLLGDTDSEEVMEHYGELKAMCERVVQERPGAIVRPGLIVGPHDPTGRFTYWPHRIARGGDVLAPGAAGRAGDADRRPRSRRVDRAALRGRARTASSTRSTSTTWGELLEACVRATGSDARLVWIAERVARRAGRRRVDGAAALDRPAGASTPGSTACRTSARVAAGLTFRPLEDTAPRPLAEAETTDDAGLKPEREAELLDEWASLASRA